MRNTPNPTPSSFTRTGGWPGGTVTALLVLTDGTTSPTILAGTKAGLFRSADGGQHWQPVENGPADPAIVAMATAQGTIFATSEGGRLYCSDDGGQSWPELTGWAGLGVGVAIALSPAYADDATLFIATADGPMRSQDRGQSWEISNFGLLDVDTLCLAISPDYTNDETLWAGTAFGGFFRSRNGGRSWRESGAGLPDAAVQCLTQGADGTLYAGTESDGVFRSADGGNTWQRAGDELIDQSINSLAVLPRCILAGTSQGLFRWADGEDGWQPSAAGDFVAFALAHTDGLAVAGAWQSGVHISTDDGASWQPANGTGTDLLTGHAPPLAALTPQNELFVADSDGLALFSTDRGASWQPLDFLLPDGFCPLITDAGSGERYTLFAWADDAIHRRTGQADWQRLTSPGTGITQLVASPAFDQDNTLFLADGDDYLYLSEDRGDSWQELSPPEAEGDVLAIAVSPFFAADQRLYAITAAFDGQHVQAEVWQSDDAGQSWTDLAGLALDTPALSLLPLADEARRPLLLAGQNRLITLYTDPESGELAVDQRFLEPDVRVVSLATAPASASGSTLWAATNRGIWQISDDTEDAICIGLAERSVVALFPSGERMGALTLGGEVWWT
ncbi:MAG: hypothetical protein KF753_23995 [Caldilineaceae bacterium]|nr:hypothetical protein [Caldilineaceae bacterium]